MISSVTGICVSFCSTTFQVHDRRNGLTLQLPIHSLEAMRELLEEILDDALVVVAPAKDVIERGKTVRLAGLFLVIKLFGVELVIPHDTPVVACCVHREAGG